MNWGIFKYAGDTFYAYLALFASAALFVAFIFYAVYLFRKNKKRSITVSISAVAAYAALCIAFSGKIAHSWLYLQENVTRSFSSYLGLTFVTAFIPPSGSEGVEAFARIATKDSCFGKGKPERSEKRDGYEIAYYEDEDYLGGVITMDGRVVYTGSRFSETRKLIPLIALFENPKAKKVSVWGDESFLFTNVFVEAGMELVDKKEKADIVFVAPVVDWVVGSDTFCASDWEDVREKLNDGGAAAYRIDARLLSRARLKTILAEFRKVFKHYRFWCTGLYDYVVVGSDKNIDLSDILKLFEEQKTFEAFASAGVMSPSEVLACYVGTDYDVEPGLVGLSASGDFMASLNAPRLAFSNSVKGRFAPVTVSSLTPYSVPFTTWLTKGDVDQGVYDVLTNSIFKVQCARRDIILAFADADRGSSSNAVERWAQAAQMNPRDPLLRSLADGLDLEGRRRLNIGNVNGALRCYENRLLIYPQDVAAIHNFGVCLKKFGRPDAAASVFARAVKLDPLLDEHRLELIECAAASSHEDIAVRQLEVLIKRHPDDPSLKLRAAKLLCRRQNPNRDVKRAVQLAEEAATITKWRDRAYVQGLADVYIESGQSLMGVGLKKKMKTMKFDK